jgi:hypothetical protein
MNDLDESQMQLKLINVTSILWFGWFMVEETEVPGENHCKSLKSFIT